LFRLMGLPPVARCPVATVTRDEESVLIVFGGLDEERPMRVPLKYVSGDAEEAELRLLAQLQAAGYDARRAARDA